MTMLYCIPQFQDLQPGLMLKLHRLVIPSEAGVFFCWKLRYVISACLTRHGWRHPCCPLADAAWLAVVHGGSRSQSLLCGHWPVEVPVASGRIPRVIWLQLGQEDVQDLGQCNRARKPTALYGSRAIFHFKAELRLRLHVL